MSAPSPSPRGAPPDTFVLTGLPRGGTTYLSAVLHHPPRVVTISDPQGVFRRRFREHGVDAAILDAFREFRAQLEAGEPIPTLEGTDGFAGRGRVDTWNQEKLLRPVTVAPGFALGMKNPEVFLAHLDVFLDAGLRCVISLRHPVSVIASWRKRTLASVKPGEPPKGFGAGVALHVDVAGDDPFERALDLHERWCRDVVARKDHPRVMLVRHEDWYTDPGQLARVGAFLDVPVKDHLEPAPIAADPPTSLTDAEVDRIRERCLTVGELGYPLEGGRLAWPPR